MYKALFSRDLWQETWQLPSNFGCIGHDMVRPIRGKQWGERHAIPLLQELHAVALMAMKRMWTLTSMCFGRIGCNSSGRGLWTIFCKRIQSWTLPIISKAKESQWILFLICWHDVGHGHTMSQLEWRHDLRLDLGDESQQPTLQQRWRIWRCPSTETWRHSPGQGPRYTWWIFTGKTYHHPHENTGYIYIIIINYYR